MADRPIIFSAPMVRALLDGRKTQTRRVLKPQPESCAEFSQIEGREARFWENGLGYGRRIPCAPGDRLYVKEAWRAMDRQDQFSGAQIGAQCLDVGYRRAWSPIQYEADGARDNWIREPLGFGTKPGRYRHSRFMPRWASRLTLVVTDVRVQRLQDISAVGSIAEGVQCDTCGAMGQSACNGRGCFASIKGFQDLWNSLHGPDAWGANPWVCAISFTVHKGNIDRMGRSEKAPEDAPA